MGRRYRAPSTVLKYEVDMFNRSSMLFLILSLGAGFAMAQSSPPAQASVMVGGKAITIRYSAPSVRGRKIFGPGGLLSRDPTYPVWRAGANSSTSLQTAADLSAGILHIPKGEYTLYVSVKDPDAWELIVSKETGQWGLDYHPEKDLGRVKMTMSKPAAPVEHLKYTLTAEGTDAVKLQLEWENHIGTVLMAVQ